VTSIRMPQRRMQGNRNSESSYIRNAHLFDVKTISGV
jgi:hypothetical protein